MKKKKTAIKPLRAREIPSTINMIFVSFHKVIGSMLVSEQLRTYPSPNPNLLSVECCLGRCAVHQIFILIRFIV